MGKRANQNRRKRQREASKARSARLQSTIDARRADKAEDKEIEAWLSSMAAEGETELPPELMQDAVAEAEGTPLEGLTGELEGMLAGDDTDKMLDELDGWLDRYTATLEGMEDGESNASI